MADLDARDEIRVTEFGLMRCPSCGELAAEILATGHCLLILPESGHLPQDGSGGFLVVECRDGERATVADFETAQAAANIALADDVWFRETCEYAKLGMPREMLWGKAPG